MTETAAKKFWDRVAEKYAAKPVANVPAYHAKLDATKARLAATDTILDVGCGTGSLALELAPCVAHVHAVDLSEEMIRIGERKAADRGIANVSFHRASISDLSMFEPASFDLICAYNVLHLVEDRAAALARLFALLRPGGALVTSTACLGESWVPYRPILRIMQWIGKAPPVWVFGVRAFEAELHDAGFVDLARPPIPGDPMIAFSIATKPPRVAEADLHARDATA